MQIALTLLISAMQLLTLVSNNPNLPQSFKDNAILIANHAVVVAQEELAKVPEPTAPVQAIINNPQPIFATSTPNLGVVVTPTPMPTPTEAPVVKNLTISKLPRSGGFDVFVIYTENNRQVEGKEVTLISSNPNGVVVNQEPITKRFPKGVMASFVYRPPQEYLENPVNNNITLTAKVGELEANLLLD